MKGLGTAGRPGCAWGAQPANVSNTHTHKQACQAPGLVLGPLKRGGGTHTLSLKSNSRGMNEKGAALSWDGSIRGGAGLLLAWLDFSRVVLDAWVAVRSAGRMGYQADVAAGGRRAWGKAHGAASQLCRSPRMFWRTPGKRHTLVRLVLLEMRLRGEGGWGL